MPYPLQGNRTQHHVVGHCSGRVTTSRIIQCRSSSSPSARKKARVGTALACRASHRSGRAQLRHPVRQRTGSQRGRDTSAEADRTPRMLSSGVAVTGAEASECSPWFPPLGPPVGSALPSTGSAEASSPASTVLWRCATSCVPLTGLGCLRLAIPCVRLSFRSRRSRTPQPRARGSSAGPLTGKSAGRRSGPPKFLENPRVPMPCSSTPAGPTRQALRRRRHGPRYVHDEGSHDNATFEAQSHGLGTRCLRFVRCLAAPDARLASRCWPLYGTGLATRRIPLKGFRTASYLSSPFPKLACARTAYFILASPDHVCLRRRVRGRPESSDRQQL